MHKNGIEARGEVLGDGATVRTTEMGHGREGLRGSGGGRRREEEEEEEEEGLSQMC
jgi:hypothetical protein